MRTLPLIVLCLTACASAPPPHAFVNSGEPAARLTFEDGSSTGHIFTAVVYEDARECTKPHFVDTHVNPTVAVAVGRPVSVSVGYTAFSSGGASWCAKAATIVPIEAEYVIRLIVADPTGACNISISRTPSDANPSEKIIERTWKKPFVDGWCKDKLPNIN